MVLFDVHRLIEKESIRHKNINTVKTHTYTAIGKFCTCQFEQTSEKGNKIHCGPLVCNVFLIQTIPNDSKVS